MKLLIVSATEMEIGPFLGKGLVVPGVEVDVVITGVGMVATTYAVTRQLQRHRYDLVLQAGVGGSYNREIALGSVVYINSDRYADIGAEDHDDYIDIFDMGLLGRDEAPHTDGRLINPGNAYTPLLQLQQATGLTVNTVSGNATTIARREQKYGCDTESMEGAALHYVCLKEGVAFAQVRAISNYVIPRDKSQWRMKDAIMNLNEWLASFVERLGQQG